MIVSLALVVVAHTLFTSTRVALRTIYSCTHSISTQAIKKVMQLNV